MKDGISEFSLIVTATSIQLCKIHAQLFCICRHIFFLCLVFFCVYFIVFLLCTSAIFAVACMPFFQAGMVWCFYSEVCLLFSMVDAGIPAAMFRKKGTEETAVTEHKNWIHTQKNRQQNMKPTKNGWPEENCMLGKLHTDMHWLLNSSYEIVKYAQIWRIRQSMNGTLNNTRTHTHIHTAWA